MAAALPALRRMTSSTVFRPAPCWGSGLDAANLGGGRQASLSMPVRGGDALSTLPAMPVGVADDTERPTDVRGRRRSSDAVDPRVSCGVCTPSFLPFHSIPFHSIPSIVPFHSISLSIDFTVFANFRRRASCSSRMTPIGSDDGDTDIGEDARGTRPRLWNTDWRRYDGCRGCAARHSGSGAPRTTPCPVPSARSPAFHSRCSRIFAIANFMRDDGSSTDGSRADYALRMREEVADGIGCIRVYQLDLVTPGISPVGGSRKQMRQILKSRR